MIYFDNAATTYPKPPEVIKTMSRATARYGANPGRGGHKMSYLTSEAVYETRKRVAEFFGTGCSRKRNIYKELHRGSEYRYKGSLCARVPFYMLEP